MKTNLTYAAFGFIPTAKDKRRTKQKTSKVCQSLPTKETSMALDNEPTLTAESSTQKNTDTALGVGSWHNEPSVIWSDYIRAEDYEECQYNFIDYE